MGASCRKLLSSNSLQAAGSVLDRVISQASSEDNTVLYKLADYKKGGLLIETYAKGGMLAAEKLIREEFSVYMYAKGKGRVINRAEYLRWKFRDQEQVVLPIEASLSPNDPLAKWEDHAACWQMCYRGALGESLLHVLIICDTKIHTRLARTLVKCYPKLSMDVVEGEEYLGASSLHLAIAYSNNELVQDLVEAGADVNQRAIGSFFLPRDQQYNPPARQTNYEGLAYLGEYPLAWTACCANESGYNLLIDSGADPDAQDSFGNMILHMVVVCDKLDMFGYALRHPKLPASNGRVNKAGFTPLTLACQLGRSSVFREMLELSAREFWRYSNITCSAYPLNALDTLLPDGRTNWNSALFIILNGTKQEHLNMLDGGIIQRLLEEKWKTFARTKFLKRLLILMLHLLLLSSAVYLRHSSLEADANPNWGLQVEDIRSGVRLATELGTIVSTLCYIILQQGDELKNQGLVAYFKQLVHEPAKLIFLASNLLLLACIPARLSQQTMLEETLLIFLLPGSWFLLMFFAGAVKLTGPFVTMIFSMITGDMFTFGIIYCIVLFGFSQSFFFLYKGFPNVQSTLFSSYPSTWMALFQVTLGDYSYSDLGQTTYPNLAKTVFAIFMVFVPILLLNMLIAMMGNTYAHVIEQSEKEWVKQWAKIVVSLERSVAQEDAHRYLQEYSIGLGPSDDPRYEQRGVMVIKSKAKTRAKQRKGALSNWKRVGKVTIAELRKRGITGEELRRLMWGRASISTPTKHPVRKAAPPEGVLGGTGNGVYAGVGSALSSTLDVMAFTHDLDLRGTDATQKQTTPDLLMNQNILSQSNQPAGVGNAQGVSISLRQSLQVPNTLQNQQISQHQINGQTLGLPQNSQMPNIGVTQGLTTNMGYQVNSQMGTNLPQMGQNLPQIGQYLPQTGQYLPQTGQYLPQTGQFLPQTGQNGITNTQMGVARSPMVQDSNQMGQNNVQTGQVRPQLGQMNPQTSHINPQMGQINPQMGQINPQIGQFNPQMHQFNPQMGQMYPQTDQINSQMGTINPQPGQMTAHIERAGIPINMTPAQMTSGMMQQQPGVTAGSQILLSAGNLQVGPPPMTGLPEIQVPYMSPELSATYEDYLHQLMVLSETTNPRPSLVRELAEKAADLDNVPVIDVNVNLAAKSARLMVAGAVSGLFGVASELPTPDSWRRDDARNHSDSEPISDSVVLGRASRARRARSASRRVGPPPPHLYVPARSMYLVASESSAVESDSKEDIHASGRNSVLCREEAAKIRAARPHCILHAAGQIPQDHSLYVVGAGNGVEPETGASERSSKKHDRRRERPKTARPRQNKVSPSPPSAERGSPLEPWATAPLSRLSKLIRSTSASTASLISQTSPEDSPRY